MSLYPSSALSQSQSSTTTPEADISSLDDLVTANHVLYKHNVLDGFGHISVRSTANPDTFYQTGTAAARITSPSNFTVYNTVDGTPVDPSVKISPYSEHYIHAAFFNQYPDVQCVIHSHARETLPFGITSGDDDPNTHLRAVIHTAGFLGTDVPVWDAEDAYSDLNLTQRDHGHNLLVNTFALGTHLAHAASKKDIDAQNSSKSGNDHQKVILQRGHGFSTTGSSIPEAVYNAIYTVENAVVLSQSLALSSSSNGAIKSLIDGEVQACTVMDLGSVMKVWPLWVREVEKDPFWS